MPRIGHVSVRTFAFTVTAVGLLLTAVTCSDDDAADSDDATVGFRVVQGSGPVQETTREEELPFSEAESEAQ